MFIQMRSHTHTLLFVKTAKEQQDPSFYFLFFCLSSLLALFQLLFSSHLPLLFLFYVSFFLFFFLSFSTLFLFCFSFTDIFLCLADSFGFEDEGVVSTSDVYASVCSFVSNGQYLVTSSSSFSFFVVYLLQQKRCFFSQDSQLLFIYEYI